MIDIDDDDFNDEGPLALEDDPDFKRGTSECDGLCDPMCDWCLVGHVCPDECGGGEDCPYTVLESEGAL